MNEKKLRALVESRNLWVHLWQTGRGSKKSYPPAIAWANSCRLCEEVLFMDDIDGRNYTDCESCLLNGYAWKPPYEEFITCLSGDSLYFLWRITHTKQSKKRWAWKIVQAHNKAIEDLLCL